MKTSRNFLLIALLLAVGLLLPSATSRQVDRQKTFRPRSPLNFKKKKSDTQEAASVPAPTRAGVENTLTNALAGSAVFALIEKLTKVGLAKADVKFPAMLGGCIGLFLLMLVTEAVSPSTAQVMFDALTPAAGLLAKWIAPFFVPGLVILPLSPSVGGTVEVLKILLTITIGFVFTITSSTFAVVALRKAQGTYQESSGLAAKTPVGAAKKPFSEASWSLFWKGSVLLGALSIWASRTGNAYASPVQAAFLAFLTLACYIWSANLPAAFVKVVHPLATSSVLVLLLVRGLAAVTNREFMDVLKSYRVASLDPMKAGAGDILMYLLGPSVVAFAVSVYSRRALLKENLLAVLTAMTVSSAGSLFATALFVRAISLGASGNAAMVRLSILSRNVTTALALVITNLVGGDISIAASVVCLTGIIGGTYGKPLLNALGITDPICRGLGMGSSSQGLGVAAMANEPDGFPFAAISMVLTAIAATSLTSIPAFKDALIKAATGTPVKAAGAAAAAAAASAAAGAASAATP